MCFWNDRPSKPFIGLLESVANARPICQSDGIPRTLSRTGSGDWNVIEVTSQPVSVDSLFFCPLPSNGLGDFGLASPWASRGRVQFPRRGVPPGANGGRLRRPGNGETFSRSIVSYCRLQVFSSKGPQTGLNSSLCESDAHAAHEVHTNGKRTLNAEVGPPYRQLAVVKCLGIGKQRDLLGDLVCSDFVTQGSFEPHM